jgi:hypothetical protein
VRRTFCRPYFKDGTLLVRHFQQDTVIFFDSEAKAYESHDIVATDWAFDGDGFALVGNDRKKMENSNKVPFARMEAEFIDTWDKDYWSLFRKSSEVLWNYRYDGLPAYTARISRGFGGVWGSEPQIKDYGDDIEINTVMHRVSNKDGKAVKFRLDGFLKSETLNDNVERRARPKRFLLLEAADGKYYIMANMAAGEAAHATDYFYILKSGETSFSKIAPPKAPGEAFAPQVLDTISLSPTHMLVTATRGKRYLYNTDGQTIRVFEGADMAAFAP